MSYILKLLRLFFDRLVVVHLIVQVPAHSKFFRASLFSVISILKSIPNVLGRLMDEVQIVKIIRQTIQNEIFAQVIIFLSEEYFYVGLFHLFSMFGNKPFQLSLSSRIRSICIHGCHTTASRCRRNRKHWHHRYVLLQDVGNFFRS